MAAHIHKRIGLVGGEPVLEIGAAVVIRLDHPRLADAELPEVAEPVLPPRHQRAGVEALVVFDAHEQPPLPGEALDRDRLLMLQDQRLHAQDVLIAPQRLHHHLEVQLIRRRDDHRLPRPRVGEQLPVQVRLTFRLRRHRVGVRLEVLPRKGRLQVRALLQRPDAGRALRTHPDPGDRAQTLQVVNRGEDQIVGDHPPANDEDVEGGFGRHDEEGERGGGTREASGKRFQADSRTMSSPGSNTWGAARPEARPSPATQAKAVRARSATG